MFLTWRSPNDWYAPYQFVFDLLIDATPDVDVSGIRNSLKARCNVDAIAKNAIRFNNYVARDEHQYDIVSTWSRGRDVLRPTILCWMTIAQRTASTGLSNIAKKPSPA